MREEDNVMEIHGTSFGAGYSLIPALAFPKACYVWSLTQRCKTLLLYFCYGRLTRLRLFPTNLQIASHFLPAGTIFDNAYTTIFKAE